MIRRRQPMRRTALARSVEPMPRRTRLRQVSTRQRERNEALRDARMALAARSGGWCEASRYGRPCTARATDAHHLRQRSLARDDSLAHLAHLCRDCHAWAHQEIAAAKRIGLLR